jgi:D-alanyl-D-alanine carboxypeptidase (penicillin-binding protein 5/6)
VVTVTTLLADAAALSSPAAAAVAGAPRRPSPPPQWISAGASEPTVARMGVIGGMQLAGRGVIVNYPSPSSPRLPDVPASAFVLADAGTGDVLAARDPHGWFPPASTLKVLTAITLMPVLKPGQIVVASRRAAGTQPSKVGLVAGQGYRVSDLFRALLMISANDAAVALAQATGSYSRAIAMMNARAQRLQADDTVARTPNGLDAKGQHSSAYDEALFARQALHLPAFMSDEKARVARFPLRPRHWVTLWNQNTMLETFPGDLGGKIGWTTPAKATFIGWARRGGRTLIVTILHCTPLTEMSAAARLLDWGFAMDGKVRPVGTLVAPLPATTKAARPGRPGAKVAAAAAPGADLTPVVAGAVVLAVASLAGIATLRRRAGSLSARSPAPSSPGRLGGPSRHRAPASHRARARRR